MIFVGFAGFAFSLFDRFVKLVGFLNANLIIISKPPGFLHVDGSVIRRNYNFILFDS